MARSAAGSAVGAGDRVLELGDQLVADGLVALGLVGVAADHEAVAHRAVVDAHLLDLEVAGYGLVAALAGQRRKRFLGVGAQLLADDVVPAGALQVAAILGRLKAAVGDPHHARELPVAQLVLDLADQRLIGLVARPAPRADRDPRPRHRHPDHDLRQVVARVLGMTERAKRRPRHAVLVDGLDVGLVALEVRRGRVEEQQVDLEVQEVGGRPVDLLGQLGLDLQQPVHRPVQRLRILANRVSGQPRDRHVGGQPLTARQLRERRQRPVGDQREQQPLGPHVQPPRGQQPLDRGVDPEPAPQPIKRPRATNRHRAHELKLRRRGRDQRLLGLQHPRQRPHQPRQRRPVELVLAAEAVDHPGHRALARRIPLVVRQLHVADLRTVLVAPPDRPQVHA